jgi:glutamyl/glutaminyl-tRNA synthetase
MHGNAKHTSGGLTASDLKYSKTGEIVSKRKSEQAKKQYKNNGLHPASAAQMAQLRSMKR